MDLWGWVGSIQEKLTDEPVLVDRIESLPGWVLDGHHARVDAVVPEMLADIRRLEQPWLEVFVRHWRLQSWVFQRQEITRALPEAVDLIERAHREDADRCPQSVCVAQDLCAAYGHADGPGYAAERVEVATETLARIDASWPCFQCIASERISALLDAGQPEQALEEIERCVGKLRDAGELVESGDFAWNRAEAYRELGRLEQALTVVDAADKDNKGATYALEKAQQQALYRALLGRLDEASEFHLPWHRISDTASLYPAWAEVEYELVRRGERAWSQELFRNFATASRTLGRQGCPRDALEIAGQAAELAVDAGLVHFAHAFIESMEAARPKLRADHGADAAIAALRSRWAVLPRQQDLPETWQGFQDTLSDGVGFDRAVAAMERWPDQRGWALQVAEFWRGVGFPERGRGITERLLEAHPEDPDIFLAAGQALLASGDLDALDTLLDIPAHAPDEVVAHTGWLRSFLAERLGDTDAAIDDLAPLLEPMGSNAAASLRHAALCTRAGLLDDALVSYNAVVAMGLDPGPHDWDRMVVARRLGRWDVVRDGCARVGIELDSAVGAIEENWGMVRLRTPGAERQLVWAMRTGPVSAVVMSVTGPDSKRERHGDRVVFEPTPLDEDPDNPLFEIVQVLDRGGFQSFALDGADPGADEVLGLRTQLESMGVVVRSTAGPGYTLVDPVLGTTHQGLYLRIAVPDGSTELASEVALHFTRFAEATSAPLVWIELAEALGDTEGVAAMTARATEWGMV